MGAPLGNKFALGMGGGRPPHYKTAQELYDAIEKYFVYCLGEFHIEKKEVKTKDEDGKKTTKVVEYEVCDRQPERPTITGLCIHLGFDSRSTLHEYSKKEEFSHPIKRAKLIIENEYEQMLTSQSPSGIIFALKNFGWEDKLTTDNNHRIRLGTELEDEYE